jgi:RNA polymerase sigma factor (sigma-70 family)
MEYSDFVQAVQENDLSKVEEHLKTLQPRLIRFLRIHMNAPLADAEDCVQEALLICFESILDKGLKRPGSVLTFLLSTCRNNYFKLLKKREELYEEVPRGYFQHPQQLTNLIDNDKLKILEWCLDQLNEEYRKFMKFWFDNPGYEAEEVAEYFDLSISNTWTRKHRLVKLLNKCYEKKSKN